MRRNNSLFFPFYKDIVIFMGTYPKPDKGIQFLNTQSSPVQSDSNGIDDWGIIQFFKMKGWMISIIFPNLKCFISLSLNIYRKIRIRFFKSLIPYGFQLLRIPSSSVLPSSKSIIAEFAISRRRSLLDWNDSSHLKESINSSRIMEATLSCKSSERVPSSLIAFSSKTVITLLKLAFSKSQFNLSYKLPSQRIKKESMGSDHPSLTFSFSILYFFLFIQIFFNQPQGANP